MLGLVFRVLGLVFRVFNLGKGANSTKVPTMRLFVCVYKGFSVSV